MLVTGDRGTCPLLDALEPQAQWREGERPGAKCCKEDSRQDPRITRQTGNGNAHMVVDPNQLLLVRGKLAGGPLVLLASCFPSVPSAVLQVCASGCRICLSYHLLLLLRVSRRDLLPVCSRYTPPSALSNPPRIMSFSFSSSGHPRGIQTHLQRQEHSVRLASQTNTGRPLLYRFEGVLDLVQLALGRLSSSARQCSEVVALPRRYSASVAADVQRWCCRSRMSCGTASFSFLRIILAQAQLHGRGCEGLTILEHALAS